MVALLDHRTHFTDVAVPHHLVYDLLAVIILEVLVVIVLVAFLVSIHVLALVFVARVGAVVELRVLLLAVLHAVVGECEWRNRLIAWSVETEILVENVSQL